MITWKLLQKKKHKHEIIVILKFNTGSTKLLLSLNLTLGPAYNEQLYSENSAHCKRYLL